jgi:hypothetical protein
MLHACTKFRFSSEARHGRPVLPELFAQNLERYNSVLRMISTIDGGGSPLPDHVLYAVPGKRGTYKRIARHAANLTPQTDTGKRFSIVSAIAGSTSATPQTL